MTRSRPRATGTDSPIAIARRAAGMTQEQLAKAVGVQAQYIGAWERGERKPKIDSLLRIAEALGVSWQDLIDHKP